MWQAMGVCVALCALFFFLMAGGMRREKQWKGAVRLTAQVTGLEYRKTWVDSSTIDGDRSSTLITLRCLWEGQPFTLQKELRGIRPSLCQGDRVPIVYLKSQGAWASWKEVRSLWPVWGLLGALCGGSAVALLFQGRNILAALSDYTVEYPNLPLSALCWATRSVPLPPPWHGGFKSCWAGWRRCLPAARDGLTSRMGTAAPTPIPCFPFGNPAGCPTGFPPPSKTGTTFSQETSTPFIRTGRGATASNPAYPMFCACPLP